MIRGHKAINWSEYLQPEDAALLVRPIEPEGWYPMETFERFGIGIIREIGKGQLDAVKMWGRLQVEQVRQAQPHLVAEGDPRGTLMRFRSLQRSLFDYDAVDVPEVLDDAATVSIAYGMSKEAERAACHQSLGFCERLVEVAGGRDVVARIVAAGWQGQPRTLIDLRWR